MTSINSIAEQVIKDILEMLKLSDCIMPFEVECDVMENNGPYGKFYNFKLFINDEHYYAFTDKSPFYEADMEYIKEEFEYWITESNVFLYKLTPQIVWEMAEFENMVKRNKDIDLLN